MPTATADDLLRLNQEILALARARAPIAAELPAGVRRLGGTSAGFAGRLNERMQRGATLDAALAAEQAPLPGIYAAIVRAGIAAGRLPAALEAFDAAYSRINELRRIAKLAMVYPLAVLFMAISLLAFAAEKLLSSFGWVGQTERSAAAPLELLVPMALWIGGAVAIVGFVITVWQGRRSTGLLGRSAGLLRWVPGGRKVIRLSACASFAEVLSLLTRQRVPLDEALSLAAGAAGYAPLEKATVELALRVSQGAAPGDERELLAALPPLVRIALLTSATPAALAASIGSAAREYELRARSAAERMAATFPALATAVIGGGVVIVYALVMLRPYVSTLLEMSSWTR